MFPQNRRTHESYHLRQSPMSFVLPYLLQIRAFHQTSRQRWPIFCYTVVLPVC
jgi:hypothetical protein